MWWFLLEVILIQTDSLQINLHVLVSVTRHVNGIFTCIRSVRWTEDSVPCRMLYCTVHCRDIHSFRAYTVQYPHRKLYFVFLCTLVCNFLPTNLGQKYLKGLFITWRIPSSIHPQPYAKRGPISEHFAWQIFSLSILKRTTSQNTHILSGSLAGNQQNLLSKYFL